MVKHDLAKIKSGVRFSYPAPKMPRWTNWQSRLSQKEKLIAGSTPARGTISH